MKRRYWIEGAAVLAVLAMLLSYAVPRFLAAQNVLIPARIPDKGLRKAIADAFGVGLDGKVTALQLARLQSFACNGWGIEDMTGIEMFTGLTRLDCHNNNIKSLDVSNLYLLEDLQCGTNELEALDLSNQMNLKSLDCKENRLKTLVLPQTPTLFSIHCSRNRLTELDIAALSGLTSLTVDENAIRELDLSACSQLRFLYCSKNRIQDLDLSALGQLEHFNCSWNELTGLDLSQNVKLKNLFCSNNLITQLMIHEDTVLTFFSCNGNRIEQLPVMKDVSQFSRIDIANNRLDCRSWEMLQSIKTNMLTRMKIPPNMIDQWLRVAFLITPQENGGLDCENP